MLSDQDLAGAVAASASIETQAGTAFALTVNGVPDGKLFLRRFLAKEQLGHCYDLTLDVHLRDEDVDLEGFVDHQTTLELTSQHPDHEDDIPIDPRRFHGVVTSAILLGRGGQDYRLRLIVQPRLALLARSQRCRIFMGPKQTIPDIIEQVLKDHGLEPGAGFDLGHLDRSRYPVRDYVVQYEESDLAFLQRWCEHEGIWYRFDQDGKEEKIVFGDSKDHYLDLVGSEHTLVPFRTGQSGGLNRGNANVFAMSQTRQIIPEQVVIQDYNWRANHWRDPAGSLLVSQGTSAAGSSPADFETLPRLAHQFDCLYDTRDQGKWLVQRRAEAYDARRDQSAGTTSCAALAPGVLFKPKGGGASGIPVDKPLCIDTVLHIGEVAVDAIHEGREGVYGNRFTAIKASEQFRLEHTTPRPLIHGVMHAIVDGNRCDDNASDDSSEDTYAYAEISPNGEYRVRMPFDLAQRKTGEDGSCWIRMAQPHSGKDYGMHFPLHVGTEVLISHIDGNPDRPVIIGTIPSVHTASPVNQHNSHQNVLRTSSGHQIVMDDLYNSQRIVIENAKSTVFEMYGRDYTGAKQFTSTPFSLAAEHAGPLHLAHDGATGPYAPDLASSRNAGNSFFAVASDTTTADQPAAGPADVAWHAVAGEAHGEAQHALGRGGGDTAEELIEEYTGRSFPSQRFWDHAAVATAKLPLDFAGNAGSYADKDFKATFRVLDKPRYTPANSALDAKNHEQADETRRDAIAKPRELTYEKITGEDADPNLQCNKYAGSIGWQWINAGPEVGLQYGRVHRRTEGEVTTYHRGHQIHSHEDGDRYEFLHKENRYQFRSGNDYRFGGGYEHRNTAGEDLVEEEFINRHDMQEVVFDTRRTEASVSHTELIATRTWQWGLSAHDVVNWKDVANVHLDYLICTTAQTMIDGDEQRATSGQQLIHVGHDQQTIVGGDHLLGAANSDTQIEGKQSVTSKASVFTFQKGFTIKQDKAGRKPAPDAPEGALDGAHDQRLKAAETMVDEAYRQAEKDDQHQKPSEVRKQAEHDARSAEDAGDGIGMEAKTIQLKSTGEFTAESTKDYTVKSSRNVKITASSQVAISGSSKVEIKGGTIHIG